MQKLRKKFESIYKKFTTRKIFFKERIEHFETIGRLNYHKRGHKLIEEAERLIDELKKQFEVDESDWDYKEINPKVKRFNAIYKELNEFTKLEWHQWLEALGIAIIVALFLRSFILGLYRVPSGSSEPNILVGDRVIGSKLAYKWGRKPQRGDFVMFYDPVFEYDQYSKINSFWQRFVGYGIPMLGLSSGPDNCVKRIIALPGDTIQGKIENGKTVIYLNGEILNEPYVNKYPLIAMEKRTGFLDLDTIWKLPVPEFIKRKSQYPIFFTYVPELDFAHQPYYKMSSESVGLEPGTLRPWLIMPGTPSKNEYGKIVDVFGPLTIPKGKYWVMGDNRKRSKDSRFWGPLDESYIYGRANMVIYSIDSGEPLWLFELIKNPIKFWVKAIRWGRTFKRLSAAQIMKGSK